jgi:glycosyltransferase involved in cell wall biosynthesis
MSGRLRIVHVITDASVNDYFASLATHADNARFELQFGSLASAGPLHEQLAAAGVQSFALGADGRREYGAALIRLVRRLRHDKPAVVQGHLLDGCFVGLMAARHAGIPVTIMTAHHSGEVPLHEKATLSALDRFVARRLASGVIAPSRQVRDTLIAFHRVPANRVRIIHHGLDLTRFDPASVVGSVRAELGLEGRLVIGSVGRFHWVKNQENLLRAFAGIAQDVPEACLLLVGAGDSSPLNALGHELGVADRLVLLPRRQDISEVFAAMDVLAHPSSTESFGQVIIEAMAMGLPVVSTPVGIAPDVLSDGECGVLATDGERSSLERALRDVLARRDEWQKMGRLAQDRARAFGAQQMVRSYEDYYEELLAQTPVKRLDGT